MKTLRLYAPLLAILLAQTAFVVFMPSSPETRNGSTLIDSALDQSGNGALGTDARAGKSVAPGTAAAAAARSSGRASGAASAAAPGGAAGDTSHCRDGRQHGFFYHAPPCAPKFNGPNAGATARGVTAKEITVVSFFEETNAQVNAVLEQMGAADSLETVKAFEQAAVDFLNTHYELYGRKIKYVFFQSDCPQSPSDVDRCRAAAQRVIRMNPFLVQYNTVFYPEVFDEFARAGITTLGGSHFDAGHYKRWAGRRFDYLPDGTTAANLGGEYYCKRLAGGKATHAGRVIHPSIGGRGEVARKLGIIVQRDDTNYRTAQELAARVKGCGATAPIYTYDNDISTSSQQAVALTNRLIQDKVTTVTCLCVTGALTIFTPVFTSANYFPEHLLPGIQWLDNEVMARSFDPEQWAHAFGPGTLPPLVPQADDEVQRVWTASGREGRFTCNTCRFWIWQPWRLLGSMLQAAGPNLDAGSFANGALSIPSRGGWEETGGDPRIELEAFGPDKYTAVSDAREIRWDPNARSPFDGQPGAYVAVNGGRRYRFGALPTGEPPFPAAQN